jgi:hypothetical protein
MKKLLVVGALLVALAITAFAGKKKPELQYAALSFTVLRENTGEPVRNASIILHGVDSNGNQDRAGFQLKTDDEGRASFDAIPYGKLRVQVIAHGYQTYGEDFDIGQPAREIVIKLNPPQRQYSIYDK